MSIMSRLKAETDELHRMAEGRELQRRLAKGTVTREQYASFLAQMYLVHQGLERRLAEVHGEHRAFEAVLRDYHQREPQLHDDLAFLGADASRIEPTRRTRRLLGEIDGDEPLALLGMLYVLEGSTNGSRFIAAALQRSQGLEPGPGLSYLDPHGELQRDRWLQFKQDMDAVGFTEAESAVLVRSAQTMFEAIGEISDELIAPQQATV